MNAPRATAWANALGQSWMQRGALGRALLPLAWAYGTLMRTRHWLYRVRWLRAQRVGVPVIVVGNVIAGGTGKTPVVISLVEHCQARGLRVGVIARGYGRRSSALLEVTRRADPNLVGDEPFLIHRRTGAPMFVASERVDAARALLQAYPSTQLIISDDGLQHLALHRDLEIGVFDDRGVGNGWLLPAGPLREPWPRPLDLVLHTGVKPRFEGYVVHRTLSNNARRWDGEAWPLAALAALSDRPLLALAAIAQPDIFFAMLRAQGVTRFETLALPDHYDFESFLPSKYKGYRLICTEKDAVKLWPLVPDALAVPLNCTLPSALLRELDARIDALLTGVQATNPLT
jgi:tetraacyldisaccharide 4'-kinase